MPDNDDESGHASRRVVEFAGQLTIPQVLRRAADTFGDREMVVTPTGRMTFVQLQARSRQMARRLIAAGVAKGTRVGLQLVNGPEWVVAFAAITRIGAVAMPFSTLYRPAELRTALRIGDVALLISSATMLGKDHASHLEEAVPGLAGSKAGSLHCAEVPYLRAIWLTGDARRAWAVAVEDDTSDATDPAAGDDLLDAIEAQVSPADWMVVIFTSGTTAEPKAVVHSQGAALRKTALASNAALHAIFGGRVLSLMPFFWVGGLQEVLAALQSGATLLTLARNDAGAAVELGRREQASCVMGNLQGLRSLFGHSDFARLIPTIRPLPARPWDGPPSSRGDKPVGLGMTETFGPWAGVDGFEVQVIDPQSAEVLDEGEEGEFRVRGYSLMQGMYKRERDEVFEVDGWFRTGDMGYVEDGQVYFTGRRNDMIKIRGANVAPAEIEAVLVAQPDVRVAFAYGMPPSALAEEIVAGVVPAGNSRPDVEQLRDVCRRELSSYKVPSAIVVLDATDIPYLASSKPDRRAVQVAVAAALRRSGRLQLD